MDTVAGYLISMVSLAAAIFLLLLGVVILDTDSIRIDSITVVITNILALFAIIVTAVSFLREN